MYEGTKNTHLTKLEQHGFSLAYRHVGLLLPRVHRWHLFEEIDHSMREVVNEG